VNEVQKGTCPVCQGTGRVAAKPGCSSVCYGYDKTTNTLPCVNCGGQYMSCKSTGQVRLRKDGTPCVHKYVERHEGNCYHTYTCEQCGDKFSIDSGG
jgi:hypothetical protein